MSGTLGLEALRANAYRLCRMVFEKPLIDTRELRRAVDPIHGRGNGELDRLQEAGFLSSGISTGDRGRQGWPQRLTLYCSLNRDAISAIRRGRTATARKIRAHAQRIEKETLGPWLETAVDSWAAFDEPGVERYEGSGAHTSWIDRMLFASPTANETEVAASVWNAAREVAEIRARYQEDDFTVRLTIGRVWRIDDALSEVRPEPPSLDDSVVFGSDEVLSAGLRLGDPVVIRHEDLSPGVFLTTIERGLDSSTRTSRVTGQPLPRHLEELLDSSILPSRHQIVRRSLRRVA